MASSQAGGGAAGGRKVAIVTGGASGIGLSMTKYFASEGYAVVIFDVNSASGVSVAKSVAAESPKATVSFKQTDVSSWEALSATFEEVYKEQGRIDVVMANAGISEQGSSSLVTLGEEKPSKPNLKVLDVNLFGAIYSVKLAAHYIQKNEVDSATNSRGLIVVTSSNAGLYPLPVAPMYSASKFGVIGLVRSLALPLERVKIRVNALAPAVLETNIAPSKSLFADMILTPMSTLVNGVRKFVENPSLSGEVAEIHGDNVTLRPPHEVVDEDSQKNLDNFWALGFA